MRTSLLLLATVAVCSLPTNLSAAEIEFEGSGPGGHDPSKTDELKQRGYCGDEPIEQGWFGSGDCRRSGRIQDLQVSRRWGVWGAPVWTWSMVGSLSNAELATGCYCIIKE